MTVKTQKVATAGMVTFKLNFICPRCQEVRLGEVFGKGFEDVEASENKRAGLDRQTMAGLACCPTCFSLLALTMILTVTGEESPQWNGLTALTTLISEEQVKDLLTAEEWGAVQRFIARAKEGKEAQATKERLGDGSDSERTV